MRDIRDMIRETNMRDRDEIEATEERIREILREEADYVRDLAKVCEQSAEMLLSAVEHSDIKTAQRMCDYLVREANNLITEGIKLRRDMEECQYFMEAC